MARNSEMPEPPEPGSMIMWMLGAEVEKNPDLLDAQAADIASKGFKGVLLTPRAGHLELRDPKMIELLKRASRASASNSLDVWILTDPRYASPSLVFESGESLEVLIINKNPQEQWNGDNLNTAIIENGKFRWSMQYPEIRPTHIHPAGGIVYIPIGIERAYMFRRSEDGTVAEIKDITRLVEWKHIEDEFTVEVTGELHEALDGWEVIAFPKFRTNFFDHTSSKSWELFSTFVLRLFEEIDNIAGVWMDEPGFYTEFGTFPYGKALRELFKENAGYDLTERLAWLVLESPDNTHVTARIDYYNLLNSIISGSLGHLHRISVEAARTHQRDTKIQCGIHGTWHGEFCGLEDMVHGSLDLWTLREHQSASFVDTSSAERLMNPVTGPDLIYSLILGRSLARMSPNRGVIYSCLWGKDFGGPGNEAPAEIVDYWGDLLDLFGARWIAHAYNYTGTLLKDHGFGPGYPDHPGWDRFDIVNEKIEESDGIFEAGEPVSDVLMAFPLETFYAAGHRGIDRIGRQYAILVDVLVRNGYQVDIFSTAQIASAEIAGGKIILHGCEFSSLIFPYGSIMSAEALEFIRKARDAGIPVITDLLAYDRSTPTELLPFRPPNENEIKAVMGAVRKVIDVIPPTCDLPHGAIANVRKVDAGYRVMLMAGKPLGEYEGTFRYSGVEVENEKRTEPLQLLLELTD